MSGGRNDDLADAAALLEMLERLVAELSKTAPTDAGVPWRGMQLTLGQCRDAVRRAQDEALAPASYAGGEDQAFVRGLQRSRLGRRIRRVAAT